MNKGIEIDHNDHLETLRRCGGYYSCPKDSEGHRLGPLVGYAGKYKAPDGEQKQWVGEIYANFAKAEEYPEILFYFADSMQEKLEPHIDGIDIFCAAPIGGYDFSKMLGLAFQRRAIKAEKKVVTLATETTREQSKLVFARHSIEKGARYAIVEDVCNNFATTLELIALIKGGGAEVTAIVCLLNRSLEVDNSFLYTPTNEEILVTSLVRLPISEYHQDDPFVVGDIERNNVVWKPKDEWNRLMEAIEANKSGEYNMEEALKIIVPPPYTFEPPNILRRKGQIVKNVWRDGGPATQEQIDKFIRLMEEGLGCVWEVITED